MTTDDEVNCLSSTPSREARVLFTTHAMLMSRCRGRRFRDTEVFHYLGEVRAVRIWDEAMLPGDVVSLNTDQLASLREPLRQVHPALAEVIGRLESELEASGGKGSFRWPDVEDVTGISYMSATRRLEQRYSPHSKVAWAGLVAVREDLRGQGLGAYVNALVLKKAVEELGAERIQEFARTSNVASCRMIEHCGLSLRSDVRSGIAQPDEEANFTR